MLLYGVGVLAGIVTVISPCAYPVLPIVFAAGAAGAGTRRPVAIIAGLVCTFLASLLFLTWLLSELHIPTDLLRNLSIALLFLVGIGLIVPRVGQLLERPLARLARRPTGDLGGGFLLGAALGLVFAPCAGTILAAVAGASATTSGVQRVGLALAYTIGVAVPLLLIALAVQRGSERLQGFRSNIGRGRSARSSPRPRSCSPSGSTPRFKGSSRTTRSRSKRQSARARSGRSSTSAASQRTRARH